MIFLDTSAFVKRYVAEFGSGRVLEAMGDDRDWAASMLARTEAQIALCHRGAQGSLAAAVQRRLADDWDRFTVVAVDAECLAVARDIGCRSRIRTLDAIHLAAALTLPRPVGFLSFDERQIEAARRLGLDVLPT